MKMFGLPYRITNRVVEFERGSKIAWCHPGKHRWRWEVAQAGDGETRVTETFDMSTSPLKPVLSSSATRRATRTTSSAASPTSPPTSPAEPRRRAPQSSSSRRRTRVFGATIR